MDRDKSEPLWLVIDTKNGGIDGFYVDEISAYTALIGWEQRLGHKEIIVVCYDASHKRKVSIGRCFLPDRKAAGNVHGGQLVDHPAPHEPWKIEAIEAVTELLRDLYDESATVFDLHLLAKRISKSITEFDIPDLDADPEIRQWHNTQAAIRIANVAIREDRVELSEVTGRHLAVALRQSLDQAFSDGIQFQKDRARLQAED